MQTGITFVHFMSASPKIEASQERMSAWNMTPIKGLMKVHALVPFRQTSWYDTCCYENEQNHLCCPGWQASGNHVRVHGKVEKAAENLVNTVSDRYLCQHTTQCVEDNKQGGRELDKMGAKG